MTDLMRNSLDHCVKCTICENGVPGRGGHATRSRPQIRRAAGGALPGRRSVAGQFARLVLGVRYLHVRVSAGRQDRRD